MIPSMPPAETLYRLAMLAETRRKAQDRTVGPNSMAEHLEFVRNGYLIANTMAEREAQNE